MPIHAYAALSPKSQLQPFSYEAPELGTHDIEIEISHCGLCHSDLHVIDDDWKVSSYPLVPGHEIIGRVLRHGSAISHLPLGQRVGVGWQRSSCLSCELCLNAEENLCQAKEATCVGHYGGLAQRILTDGRFAFPIPDGLDSACVAPLLCGGVTVYAPLRRFNIGAKNSVGVVGIGGLGHIAIAILKALGAEITAFSSSADKREEAMRLGAHHFVSSTDTRDIRKHTNRLDLILSTVNVRLDWITYLQTLRPNGTLCLVGIPPGLLQIPIASLLGQKSIVISEIGSRAIITDLLHLADRHQIRPQVEIAPMHEVQAAVERLRKNQVRYRMVLENSES